MKILGDTIFIQKGETWSLDFQLENANGKPFCIPNIWRNPYLLIRVSNSLYEQSGAVQYNYWLDLSDVKRFTGSDALYVPPYQSDKDKPFAISEVMSKYNKSIVLDKTKDNDITNYLFCTDPDNDGKLVYKYVEDYTLDSNGDVTEEYWTEYNCRFVKYFNTRNWTEHYYYYDAIFVSGVSVLEHLNSILIRDGLSELISDTNTEIIREAIASLKNEEERKYIGEIFESGVPLMPEYDSKVVVWSPKNIIVDVDL